MNKSNRGQGLLWIIGVIVFALFFVACKADEDDRGLGDYRSKYTTIDDEPDATDPSTDTLYFTDATSDTLRANKLDSQSNAYSSNGCVYQASYSSALDATFDAAITLTFRRSRHNGEDSTPGQLLRRQVVYQTADSSNDTNTLCELKVISQT